MIYFDNAATTLQKPPSVRKAVIKAMEECGNPGRGGHKAAMKAAETVYNCRCSVSELFNLKSPERVIFTQNATHALNIAIKSILHNGGKALVSGYEHNSVIRPLEELKGNGVSYKILRTPIFNLSVMAKTFTDIINKEDFDCVIVNHISNVFGQQAPIYLIDKACEKRGIPLIIDASQSAGCSVIDISRLKAVEFVCMPGHKGLYGPQGTGILLQCKDNFLYSILQGGTGSNSSVLTQPGFLPDIHESGTLNVHGIAGLNEGIKSVIKHTVKGIASTESELLKTAISDLSDIHGIKLFTASGHKGGVLSFTSEKYDSETLASLLGDEGICVRGGIHCAPVAHQTAGTEKYGTVRISFSVFNTTKELKKFVSVLNKILS